MSEYIILGIIGLLSLISGAFIVERFIALRRDSVLPLDLWRSAQEAKSAEELARLHILCERKPSPLGRLIETVIDHLDLTRTEMVELVQTRARAEIDRLERGLVVLEITTGIAPLLGLVGTIIGMIQLFGALGTDGLNDSAAFASGISLALRATLFGLLVAIPALISWSLLSKKVESLTIELESFMDAFVRRFYRETNRSTPKRGSVPAGSQPAPKNP